MQTEKIMRKTVEEHIANSMMFTSIDICNDIKRGGYWVSNSDVATFLRANTGIMNRNSYMSTMIKVDSDGLSWWANCYHHTMDYPDRYLSRDSRAITPEQFKDLYEPKPVVKKENPKMDTKEIVVLDNGVPMTDTRILADTFKKRHADVLRKLEALGVSEEFGQRNFTPSNYLNAQGKSQPMYKMTRDGWAFLVMGFTGVKATAFKEKYIGAFNAMEKELSTPKVLTRMDILQMAMDSEKRVLLLTEDAKVNAPKVEYHDTVVGIGNGVKIGSFSKTLAPDIIIGQNKLFSLLRDHGILQHSDKDWNIPYQQYISLGFFVVSQGTRKSTSEGSKLTYTTYITGRGQIWLTKKLKKILNA